MDRYEIPLRPVPKNNSRPILRSKTSGKPFLGKSKKLSDYEAEALLILRAAKNSKNRKTLSGVLKMSVSFEFTDSCRADADNLLKTTCDLLQAAGIVENDKMIKQIEILIVENSTQNKTVITIGSL